MPSARPTIPVEDRLFSLILALLASSIGLSKAEIFETVRGYKEHHRSGQHNPSLDRMFERDKEILRELGVPVESFEPPDDPGNNQSSRYRIPRAAFELPAEVSFSPEETRLLALAARVWRQGSLSAEARRALFKLDALGVGDPDPVIGYAPRLRPADAAFSALDNAIASSRSASFDYLRPGQEEATERTVVPLALVLYEGRWHLHALHEDSGQHRTYLLRRIVGPVREGRIVNVPEGDHGQEALAELEALARSQRAELVVSADSDAALRLGGRATARWIDGGRIVGGRIDLGYIDVSILADELAGFGPEVHVIAPESLRSAVITRLEAVRAAHG